MGDRSVAESSRVNLARYGCIPLSDIDGRRRVAYDETVILTTSNKTSTLISQPLTAVHAISATALGLALNKTASCSCCKI